MFESIKNMLKGIYLNVKKGTWYVIQLGFRISNDEILDILISRPSTPITSGPPKARKASRKTNIKKDPRHAGIDRKTKKENSDSQLNVRKFQLLILRLLLTIQQMAHKRTASKMDAETGQSIKQEWEMQTRSHTAR